MHRRRSAALWGLVGLLVVLASAEAFVLLGLPLPLGVAGVVGLAVAVGGTVAGVAYALEHRLTAKGQP